MKSSWPAATARRIGLRGEVDFTVSRVGMTLHLPCVKGDHMVDFTVPPGSHPDQVALKLLAKGWTMGRYLTCPDHSRKEKVKPSPAQKAAPMNARKVEAMATTTTTTPPAPSEAAKKAKRLIYQALEDYYDDVTKAYRPGYSDEKIAKEVGASLDFVRQIRESDFGPIGEHPELAEMRREIAELRNQATEIGKTIEGQISKLSNRLAAICKANGWPHPL